MNFAYWQLLEIYKKREDDPRVETKLSGNDVVYVFSEDGRLSESVEKLARKVGDPTTITRTYSYE